MLNEVGRDQEHDNECKCQQRYKQDGEYSCEQEQSGDEIGLEVHMNFVLVDFNIVFKAIPEGISSQKP